MDNSNTINFTPRLFQQCYLTELNPLDTLDVLAHRRGGKTMGAVACKALPMVASWYEQKEFSYFEGVVLDNPKVMFFAPTREQARRIVWHYFLQFFDQFPSVKIDNSRLEITIPRPFLKDNINIALKSYKYHNSVRGDQVDLLFLDEFQLCPENAYARSIKPLTDSRGGITIRSGTSLQGSFYNKLLKDRAAREYELLMDNQLTLDNRRLYIFPVSATKLLSPERQAEIEEDIGKAAYDAEYECVLDAPLKGKYYSDIIAQCQVNSEVNIFNYDPDLPLCLACDIGVGESFASWLYQMPDDQTLVILDYYSDYTTLIELRQDIEEDWGDLVKYLALPHDGKHRKLGAVKEESAEKTFKAAFPEARILYCPKPYRVGPALQKAIEDTRLIRFVDEASPHPSKGTIDTDYHQGLTRLLHYGEKYDRQGAPTGKIDNSGLAPHTADAWRIMLGAHRVSSGRFTIMPSAHERKVVPLRLTNKRSWFSSRR